MDKIGIMYKINERVMSFEQTKGAGKIFHTSSTYLQLERTMGEKYFEQVLCKTCKKLIQQIQSSCINSVSCLKHLILDIGQRKRTPDKGVSMKGRNMIIYIVTG